MKTRGAGCVSLALSELLISQSGGLRAHKNQLIPDHGNSQKKRTILSGYVSEYDCVGYQNYYQVF